MTPRELPKYKVLFFRVGKLISGSSEVCFHCIILQFPSRRAHCAPNRFHFRKSRIELKSMIYRRFTDLDLASNGTHKKAVPKASLIGKPTLVDRRFLHARRYDSEGACIGINKLESRQTRRKIGYPGRV